MSGKARGAALLLTLVSPILLYLIVRVAAASLTPSLAATLPPQNPASLLRPLIRGSLVPGARLGEQVRDISRRAAVASPLAFEPFFIAAKFAEQAGQLPKAITLLEEARRRRPSYLPTRLQLLAYYGQVRRFDGLLHEMDFVLRSSEEMREAVFPELVKLLRDPQGRAALDEVLSGKPSWREDFFKAAQERSVRPEDALALLQLAQARAPGDVALERDLYLRALVSDGQYARARALWLAGFPAGERARHALLFDGDFSSGKAVPPFAWTLADGEAGRAEILSRGADEPLLDVQYFGSSPVVLAEQMLALSPGSYWIYATGRKEGAAPSQLYWSISCIPSEREIGKLELNGLPVQSRRLGAAFAVPSTGCSGQRLRLRGLPGDISGALSAQFTRLEVSHAP